MCGLRWPPEWSQQIILSYSQLKYYLNVLYHIVCFCTNIGSYVKKWGHIISTKLIMKSQVISSLVQ